MAEQIDLNTLLAQATTTQELGLSSSIVVDLTLRLLFAEGEVSVGRFADVLKLHPQIVDEQLSALQQERQVEVAKAGTLGRLSYIYRLTGEGSARARDALDRSQYVGPVPVPFELYNKAIEAQTASGHRRVTSAEVKQAIAHLILPENFHRRIGPAVNSATSLFLYGPSGNGKTTIAQAIGRILAGTDPIWLPYAITTAGQIVQVHDPQVHTSVKLEKTQTEQFRSIDRRWGLFVRPAVTVGGELKMEALDLRFDPIAKFYEAPLQLKANGGMFLIDDFGRQQVSPQDLLNRWIVPLESGVDFLRLQTGQTLEVPFRQLIVFSTNLDPAQLVDAAFLRRIQMKVEVGTPDEKLFYQIFARVCQAYNLAFDKDSFLHLVRKWYVEPRRVLQAVHPRDLIRTIVSICNYEGVSPRLTPELVDEACRSYFVD
ncbi:MAG TPA: ATP-binding protein [Anaerolineales bacterium]|nr:ATP-binding protein [Anaerolineales bacterium]